MTPGSGMRFTTGSAETSPRTEATDTEASRNAGGSGSGTAPRDSGAAMTSESKRPSALSSAAKPIGSGASHANTTAVAAFLTPNR